jgi:hypothetical protein
MSDALGRAGGYRTSVSTSASDQDPRGNASVLLNVRGVPWWVAVLIAVAGAAVGFGVDLGSNSAVGVIAWTLTIIGVVLAALAVRRHAIFTVMVQPPLVVVFGLIIGYLIALNGSVLNLGLKLVSAFPLMLAATAAGLVIGMIRIIAQPLRHQKPRAKSGSPSGSASHV